MDKIDKLKWQIHAETSISQIMFWIILWKLFGGWVSYLAIIFIVANVWTMFKSANKLGIKYFKD